ncbi:MAG: HAD hydrolase-like protein [Lachnospiraceae bacterium]|nr:HAD hydrolase-like protein [Lachnospiraceae bacterium]MDD7327124.1 HAD hydrolase-like protein [Lachnospiraceae bacterium]MDY2759853.1 HAD hydrolase-like protein [Lachnospiraceae bacterium]
MRYRNIFFDMDGTITDSGAVIMGTAQYALDHFGYHDEPLEKLRRFVGPSLMDSFQNLYGFSEEKAAEATRIYREKYEAGAMYDVTIYPGIVELLQRCNDAGLGCFIVTSKVEDSACLILEKLGIMNLFRGVIGPARDDPSSDKDRLINRAVDDFSLKKTECIMIGDTHFDIDGARRAGIDSIAVTYGYGDSESIKKAGPTYTVSDPHEISEILLK